jgi:hypothetical protein
MYSCARVSKKASSSSKACSRPRSSTFSAATSAGAGLEGPPLVAVCDCPGSDGR